MADTQGARLRVVWGDLDGNGHMANRAYLDYATEARFQFLAVNGFTPEDFRKHGIGPIVFRDRVSYFKELRFMDRFRVDFAFENHNAEGSRFRVLNRFWRDDELCAEVDTDGGWFDLLARKVVAPPADLATALRAASAPE